MERTEDNGLMLTIFLKNGLAGYGEGTHQNQVAIYLETYFIRKNKEKLSFIYRYII